MKFFDVPTGFVMMQRGIRFIYPSGGTQDS